jgi:RHS repeat-associated protein
MRAIKRGAKGEPSAATSIFAYDGTGIVQTVNASGSPVACNTQGPMIDEPLAELRGATASFYEADALGSITSLSESSGALAQTYTYDSFGSQAASSGSVTNFFQYAGREFDIETGLYYYRDRYYDPRAGRFLSEDPIGFNGGADLYGYVYNDPTEFTDPFGLNHKCSALDACDKSPGGPQSGRPTPVPVNEPCPLVAKAFGDYEVCLEQAMGSEVAAGVMSEGVKNFEDQSAKAISSPPNSEDPPKEPSGPSIGLGNLASAAGSAYLNGVVKCLREQPLAGLDPRFPKDFDVGPILDPGWWQDVEGFFDISWMIR